jgi:hypothetical protein
MLGFPGGVAQFKPSSHPDILSIPSLELGVTHRGMVFSNGNITDWNDDSPNGRDLSPLTTDPQRVQNRFNSQSGVIITKGIGPAASITLTRPWSVFMVIYPRVLGTLHRILDSEPTNAGVRIIGASDALAVRDTGGNKQVSGNNSIQLNKKHLVEIYCASNGALTSAITVDGVRTEYDEGNSSTEDFVFTTIGRDSAAQDVLVNAVYLFNDDLQGRLRQIPRRALQVPMLSSVGLVGASNTRDAIIGYVNAGATVCWQAAGNYAGNHLGEWNDKINDPPNQQPWISYENSAGLYPDTDRLWFHVMLQNGMDYDQEKRDWLTNVLAEARRILGKGDVDTYFTPLARYIPGVACTQPDFTIKATEKLIDWGIANLNNCFRGPNLIPIDSVREHPGNSCHVGDDYMVDDGVILEGFFGG